MFDPYHKWLGIPPKDQPPNHYRLLGIDLSESDPDVIEAAANRQMAYLQGCAAGPHVALAHKLLEQIAAARRCLLSPPEKAEYDARLKANVPSVPLELPDPAAPSGSPQGALTTTIPAPATPRASYQDRAWYDGVGNRAGGPVLDIRRPRKHRSIVGIAFLGMSGLALVAVLCLTTFPGKQASEQERVFKASEGAKVKKLFLFDLHAIEWRGLRGLGRGCITSQDQHFRISVNGMKFPLGLGTHPAEDGLASVKFKLSGLNVERFTSLVAVNDNANGGSGSPLTFMVLGDGKILWTSQPVQACGRSQECSVNVSTIAVLELRATCAGPHDWGHAVWLDPCLVTE
jgi:hypothetical protein